MRRNTSCAGPGGAGRWLTGWLGPPTLSPSHLAIPHTFRVLKRCKHFELGGDRKVSLRVLFRPPGLCADSLLAAAVNRPRALPSRPPPLSPDLHLLDRPLTLVLQVLSVLSTQASELEASDRVLGRAEGSTTTISLSFSWSSRGRLWGGCARPWREGEKRRRRLDGGGRMPCRMSFARLAHRGPVQQGIFADRTVPLTRSSRSSPPESRGRSRPRTPQQARAWIRDRAHAPRPPQAATGSFCSRCC